MELVGLGLPLQGPGWTEYARVRGYVGVQVKRGRHCVHVASLKYTRNSYCACFCTPPAYLVCYQWPGPNHAHTFDLKQLLDTKQYCSDASNLLILIDIISVQKLENILYRLDGLYQTAR